MINMNFYIHYEWTNFYDIFEIMKLDVVCIDKEVNVVILIISI